MDQRRSLLIATLAIAVAGPAFGGGIARREALKDAPLAVTSVVAEDLELRLSVVEELPFDGLRFSPGKKLLTSAEARAYAEGWDCEIDGKSVICRGPLTSQAHVGIYLDGVYQRPKKIPLSLERNGREVSIKDLVPIELGRIEIVKDAHSVLDLPSDVAAGETFMVTAQTPINAGHWTFNVGGESYGPIDPTLPDQLDVADLPYDRYFFRMPEDVDLPVEASFSYTGPFGEEWVLNAETLEYVWADGPKQDCEPGLTACQEMTVVDGELCVCGCFPDYSYWTLTLDGKPIPIPNVASATMVRFPLPEGTEPGKHTVAWPGKNQSFEFEAVEAWGAVDQETIQLGNSATLTFGLDGTELGMPMWIEKVQGSVSIAGGDAQLAFTKGGPENTFDRVLNTYGVGPFAVDFVFKTFPCPCTREEQERFLDDDLITHPMSTMGSLDSTIVDTGKLFPIEFESDSVVTRTPKPPFAEGQDIAIQFLQLGLKGKIPGYGDIVFEERIDADSYAEFQEIELGEQGGFGSGRVDLKLYTDFSTPFFKKSPLKPGKTLELGLDNFKIGGKIPPLGSWTFVDRDDEESTVLFEDIQKDASGKNIYGKATFRLYGIAGVKYQF